VMEREGRILLVVAAPFYGRLMSDERFVQLVLLSIVYSYCFGCLIIDHCGSSGKRRLSALLLLLLVAGILGVHNINTSSLNLLSRERDTKLKYNIAHTAEVEVQYSQKQDY
jgi:hypothetical protein